MDMGEEGGACEKCQNLWTTFMDGTSVTVLMGKVMQLVVSVHQSVSNLY